jgi:hypothetical protein
MDDVTRTEVNRLIREAIANERQKLKDEFKRAFKRMLDDFVEQFRAGTTADIERVMTTWSAENCRAARPRACGWYRLRGDGGSSSRTSFCNQLERSWREFRNQDTSPLSAFARGQGSHYFTLVECRGGRR